MLELRAAEIEDSAQILALIQELADYEQLRAEVVTDVRDIETALFGRAPRVFCTLAEWRDPAAAAVTVGFALWFYNFSTFKGRHGIYLEDLFVRPTWRDRGIGRALLQSLAARCVAENLARLEWAVLDWNQPALDFYASLGAQGLTQWVPHRLTGAALQRLGAPRTPESPSPPPP
jgi:GNAT superfamily N-acetyltransferase